MSCRRVVLPLAAILTAALSAPAEIIFSNVQIEGTLATGATYVAEPTYIDFTFPDADTGDDVDPRRVGNIVITFEVTSDQPLALDALTIEGALSGSGIIFFNEVVEDLAEPGVIATHNALLDDGVQLPYESDVSFDRASTHIKVKKSLLLTAEDTNDVDLASVTRIRQDFVPEPSAAVTLGLLGLIAYRRR